MPKDASNSVRLQPQIEWLLQLEMLLQDIFDIGAESVNMDRTAVSPDLLYMLRICTSALTMSMLETAVMKTDRWILEVLSLDISLPQFVQFYGRLASHPHGWGCFQGENLVDRFPALKISCLRTTLKDFGDSLVMRGTLPVILEKVKVCDWTIKLSSLMLVK